MRLNTWARREAIWFTLRTTMPASQHFRYTPLKLCNLLKKMTLREPSLFSQTFLKNLSPNLTRRLAISTYGPPPIVSLGVDVLRTELETKVAEAVSAARTGRIPSCDAPLPAASRCGVACKQRAPSILADLVPTQNELVKARLITGGYRKCQGVVGQPLGALSSEASRNVARAKLAMRLARPRATSSLGAQKRVIYIDQPDSWYPPEAEAATITAAVDAGFNVIILAFWCSNGNQLPGGACDMCAAWQRDIPPSLQISTVEYAHSKGAIVMAACGGATDVPWDNLSGADFGRLAATWVLQNHLDGLDFDMENYQQGFVMYQGSTTQQAVDYIVDANNAARAVLGASAYISHAPQAPYFGPVGGSSLTYWTGALGGYTSVYAALPAGSIDFFNVQFYNQGETMYVDYAGLVQTSESGGNFPGTAVVQIASYGIPLSAIVVGKYLDPLNPSDGTNGYVAPFTLGQFVGQAQIQYGFTPSVMVWQWPALAGGGGGQAVAQKWLQDVQAGIAAAA